MTGFLAALHNRAFAVRIYVRMAALFLIIVSVIALVQQMKTLNVIDEAARSRALISGVWIFIGVLWLVPVRTLAQLPTFLSNLFMIAAIGFAMFVQGQFLAANFNGSSAGAWTLMAVVSSLILTVPALLAFLLLVAQRKLGQDF